MNFVALDFETANPSFASICQIGVVVFADGVPINTWQTLVDPEDYFDGWHVSIHGICEKDVVSAPTFPEVVEELRAMLAGQVVIHHTAFDKAALASAFEKHRLTRFDCQWLDTARVVRRAWPQFSARGYGLKNVANSLGVEFKHHTAHEDARAAGEILIHAIRHSGLGLAEWLARVRTPIGTSGKLARDGNPEGALFGETVVFTGTLSLPKSQMADLAAELGCDVTKRVTRATTLLVVGDQDIRRLAGHDKSSNHRKAESLRETGQAIRILTESDFERLVNSAKEPSNV